MERRRDTRASAQTGSTGDGGWLPISSALLAGGPPIRAPTNGSSSPRTRTRPDVPTAAWVSNRTPATPGLTANRRAEPRPLPDSPSAPFGPILRQHFLGRPADSSLRQPATPDPRTRQRARPYRSARRQLTPPRVAHIQSRPTRVITDRRKMPHPHPSHQRTDSEVVLTLRHIEHPQPQEGTGRRPNQRWAGNSRSRCACARLSVAPASATSLGRAQMSVAPAAIASRPAS